MKEVEKKVKKKMFINIKVFDKKHKHLKINKVYTLNIKQNQPEMLCEVFGCWLTANERSLDCTLFKIFLSSKSPFKTFENSFPKSDSRFFDSCLRVTKFL